MLLKYRKVHLPGHAEFDPARKVQHLEKRYFEVGDLGFPVVAAPMGGLDAVNMGLMICNDRRWPEAWRVLGLQSVELVMLGYNTPSINQDAKGFEAHHLRVFHSHLSVQAGAYQNACFAIATAKAGVEDGCELFGHSIIVNPQGEILAQATSWDDELITADLRPGPVHAGADDDLQLREAPSAGGVWADHRAGRGGGAGEVAGLGAADHLVDGADDAVLIGFGEDLHELPQ